MSNNLSGFVDPPSNLLVDCPGYVNNDGLIDLRFETVDLSLDTKVLEAQFKQLAMNRDRLDPWPAAFSYLIQLVAAILKRKEDERDAMDDHFTCDNKSKGKKAIRNELQYLQTQEPALEPEDPVRQRITELESIQRHYASKDLQYFDRWTDADNSQVDLYTELIGLLNHLSYETWKESRK